ncbi:Glycosyl hydrolase family 47 protein [Trichomonas vaginalis G3]|uniref:alpha-1,2-Mannosidase n=1 Tax=Trichomonas vaginalis (strain ATCC PRA-98 / G3) TaxID=412133 RepID=A2DS11_TRIV3|nr:glycosyl hydrolase [Trichomonas vaginalis G3]EAY16781.1 Glycosyl hydrolase family 47 protein [Trichomonas vaginalis G3]KAI5490808.1 mannosyl-oligosaccharide 1,2-alpha-mannosidase protein [Trichomonas vaginalis G3]|eukprot:XP_001329004.1 glycosyl hydrolase [Trichomonas vaginalis G3]
MLQLHDPNYIKSLREEIKFEFKNAFNEYMENALGYDHYSPITRHGYSQFGLKFSLFDSLDTLLLMNLTEEFENASKYVLQTTNFTKNSTISVFESTIRDIGGLISAYEQTGQRKFLDLAEKLALVLEPAFKTPTGFPYAYINPGTNYTEDHIWNIQKSLLSDIGSLQIEFYSLTYHTGNMKYWNLVNYIETIANKYILPSIYFSYQSTYSEVPTSLSFDAFGDSYYEYLLKMALLAPQNSTLYSDYFITAIKQASKQLLVTSRHKHLEFFKTTVYGQSKHQISHLSYFLPGILYLASREYPNFKLSEELADRLMETSVKLHKMTKTGLSGDVLVFGENGMTWEDSTYKLRPEYIESLFYQWRVKHKTMSRRLAEDFFNSLKKYSKIGNAYSSVSNVDSSFPGYEDQMDSFFLAETMKYLYLIFCDDDVISLDDYVFTTQGHYIKKKDHRR